MPDIFEQDSEILFLGELKKEFLERTQERMPLIQKALESTDFPGLAHEAHDIKGTAGLFGLDGLGEIARQLQEAGEKENLKMCTDLVRDLQEQVVLAVEAAKGQEASS